MKQFGQKTVYFSFVFLLFVFPLFSFARSPYATELEHYTGRATSVSTIRATSSSPFFVTGVRYTGTSFGVLSCDGKYFIQWSSFYFNITPPLRCGGAIVTNLDGAGTHGNVDYEIYGYEMSDTDFNAPVLVSTSTSSGGGGGGGTFDGVIQPESFDGFYLFFGILVFMWAWTFYVFYFRPKQ